MEQIGEYRGGEDIHDVVVMKKSVMQLSMIWGVIKSFLL